MTKLPFSVKRASDSLGFLLWQTTMVWQRQIKTALLPYDITHPQFVILATLLWFEAHDYETTQVSITNWTKLDKMTVSKALKGLSVMELIVRREHQVDTRAKSVSL